MGSKQGLTALGTVVSVNMPRTVVSLSYMTTMRSPMAGRKLKREIQV
jgi:ribosomal protein S17